MFFSLELVVRGVPHVAAAQVREACSAAGVLLLGAHPLSNKALVYEVELSAGIAGAWLEELSKVGELSGEGVEALIALARGASPGRDLRGGLHVTLVHEESDLSLEVPRIPG